MMRMADAGVPGWIGVGVDRVEDPRYLAGGGSYVADVAAARQALHVAFVRSPYAHALIGEIDAREASELDGVILVLTGRELAAGGIELVGSAGPAIPALASVEARYVGEPVVAVVAEDRYVAEDAAELVIVDYEPLPAVTDVDDAVTDRVAVHADLATNVVSRVEAMPEGLDTVFGSAHLVVSDTFRTQLQTAMPLETRGVVANFERGSGELTVVASTQMPHIYRDHVCAAFGLSHARVRVVAPDVGGAFGIKLAMYPEDLVVVHAAMVLSRPVAWISDRREALLADCQARGATYQADAAFDQDGRFLALRARMIFPAGAYPAVPYSGGASELFIGSLGLPGPYKVGSYGYAGEVVLTNTPPTTTYRATGGPGATWVTESLLDTAARRLRLGRDEIRRRNMIRSDEFPFDAVSGVTYDRGSYLECFERALERIGYAGFEDERRQAAAADGVRLGLGLACYVEPTSYGVAGEGPAPVLPYDPVTVRMEPTGQVSVAVSISSQGQGHATTIAQLVAGELGIDLADVHVRAGDTALSGYGGGTHGSRSIAVGGASAIHAARRVRAKLTRVAADVLEVDVRDLEMREGAFAVTGAPERTVSIADIAYRCYHLPHRLPDGEEPGLEETARHTVRSRFKFTNGSHACVVAVDPTKGTLRILRYVVVQDCGTIVNPKIVEGQIRGAVAQGIGSAFLERIAYGEDGENLTTTWLDYLMPNAADMPPTFDVSHIETPSDLPGGMKGMGEAGLVAAPAALATAVEDALGGVSVRRLPVGPEQMVAFARAGDGAPEP
jgi:carbon-monoxide dehydrogenase large subunit